MKSLQEYVLENVDQNIGEGKVWDTIKDWFKSLFEPTDRKFDRYNPDNDISGLTLDEYIEYLDDNFNEKYLKFKKIDKKELKKMVYPNNIEPNKDGEIGFYNFIDNIDKDDDNTLYFAFVYDEKNIKDTVCLINCINKDNKIELLNVQILKEYIKFLPIKRIIDISIKDESFVNSAKSIFIQEKTDKNLYNQLINDCEFDKEYDKELNQNIATKELK